MIQDLGIGSEVQVECATKELNPAAEEFPPKKGTAKEEANNKICGERLYEEEGEDLYQTAVAL